MIRKIKKIAVGAVMAVAGLMTPVFALTQPVMADVCPTGTVKQGQSVNNLTECNVEGENNLRPTIQGILNVVISVLGLIAVIMIIMGGFTYITSAGDTAKLTKARNTIMYGVIGLVIAVLAFAIVNFVLDGVFKNGGVTK